MGGIMEEELLRQIRKAKQLLTSINEYLEEEQQKTLHKWVLDGIETDIQKKADFNKRKVFEAFNLSLIHI